MPVQLNPELQFGQSMTNGRVSALIVTPPNGNTSVNVVTAPGEIAKVTLQSKPGGFRWQLENLPETSYFLVYGTTAASAIRVDGELLQKVTTNEYSSMPIGWKADLAGNRLVIHLQTRQVEQGTPTTVIEVDFNPAKD